jgi:hypothetical protein
MKTVTKIACRLIGAVSIGSALYDATRVSKQYGKNYSQIQQQNYLERTYFNSRTLDSTSYTGNAIRKKVSDIEMNNPIPSTWGKIKGKTKGFFYGLSNNLPIIACGSLALLGKNFWAKFGAIGSALCFLYTVLRQGFGLGKNHPMD